MAISNFQYLQKIFYAKVVVCTLSPELSCNGLNSNFQLNKLQRSAMPGLNI